MDAFPHDTATAGPAFRKGTSMAIKPSAPAPTAPPVRDFSRLFDAHTRLQDALREAIKLFDEHGYHYYSPELCDAIVRFEEEVERAGVGSELNRRATLVAALTAKDTPYAEAVAEVYRQCGSKYVPFEMLKGCWLGCKAPEEVQCWLTTVRRLLGNIDSQEFTPSQTSVMHDWERELELIDDQARQLHVAGCRWLRSLSDYGRKVRNGAPLPTDRPSVTYNQQGYISSIESMLTIHQVETLRGMRAAAQDIFTAISNESQTAILAAPSDCQHSKDFASVIWHGESHEFTKNQAAVVKMLWEAHERRTPSVRGDTLLEESDIGSSLRVLFRRHAAWTTMIVSGGTKGSYRLSDNSASHPAVKTPAIKKLPRARKRRA